MPWTETEENLIKLMKLFPILYDCKNTGNDRATCRLKVKAWESLARLMLVDLKDLHSQWTDILYSYIKTNISIQNGDIEQVEKLRNDGITAKYLDGSLSFLDPHISHIKRDADIRGYMQDVVIDINTILFDQNEYLNDLKLSTNVTQDMLREILNTRSDKITVTEDDMECILGLVRESVDQILNELTPSQIERSDTNTNAMETEHNQSTRNTNKGINVEEKDMKTFCNNLADYVISSFSSEQQITLRKQIGSLVTDMELQK